MWPKERGQGHALQVNTHLFNPKLDFDDSACGVERQFYWMAKKMNLLGECLSSKKCSSHNLSQSLTRNQFNHALFSLCPIDSPWIDITGGHWGNIKNECDVISFSSTCPMKSTKAFYTSWLSLVKMQKNNHWQGRPRWSALKTFKWLTQTFATKEEGSVVKLGIESMATTKLRVAIRWHVKPYRKKS